MGKCGHFAYRFMMTVRRNFWRLVYHLLCCCCFSDRNLKYRIPNHYLVDTPDQTVEELQTELEQMYKKEESLTKSLSLLWKNPDFKNKFEKDLSFQLGPYLWKWDETQTKIIRHDTKKILTRKLESEDTRGEGNGEGNGESNSEGNGEGNGESNSEGNGGGDDESNGGGGGREEVRIDISGFKNRSPDLVVLYFSASWCPPCKELTPRLLEWYQGYQKEFQKNPVDIPKLEIIWIGIAEAKESSHIEYLQQMTSWYALPYQSSQSWFLENHYKIVGFPSLFVVRMEDMQTVAELDEVMDLLPPVINEEDPDKDVGNVRSSETTENWGREKLTNWSQCPEC